MWWLMRSVLFVLRLRWRCLTMARFHDEPEPDMRCRLRVPRMFLRLLIERIDCLIPLTMHSLIA